MDPILTEKNELLPKICNRHGTKVQTSQKISVQEKYHLIAFNFQGNYSSYGTFRPWRKQRSSGSFNPVLGFYPAWHDEIVNETDNSAS